MWLKCDIRKIGNLANRLLISK